MPKPATATPVDLHRLPAWLRYPLALTVVAFVVWLALRFGGADAPAPPWITRWLVPVLAMVWATAAMCRIWMWWRARRRR